MVFLFEILPNTVPETVWEQGVPEGRTTQTNFIFLFLILADVFGRFRLNILFAMQSKEVWLENNIQRSFPTLFRKYILFLFDFGKDAFHKFNIFSRNYLKILFLLFRNII